MACSNLSPSCTSTIVYERERESLDDLESLDLGMEYEELGMDLVMERANWPTGGCYVLQSPEGLMGEREREGRPKREGKREKGRQEKRGACVYRDKSKLLVEKILTRS